MRIERTQLRNASSADLDRGCARRGLSSTAGIVPAQRASSAGTFLLSDLEELELEPTARASKRDAEEPVAASLAQCLEGLGQPTLPTRPDHRKVPTTAREFTVEVLRRGTGVCARRTARPSPSKRAEMIAAEEAIQVLDRRSCATTLDPRSRRQRTECAPPTSADRHGPDCAAAFRSLEVTTCAHPRRTSKSQPASRRRWPLGCEQFGPVRRDHARGARSRQPLLVDHVSDDWRQPSISRATWRRSVRRAVSVPASSRNSTSTAKPESVSRGQPRAVPDRTRGPGLASCVVASIDAVAPDLRRTSIALSRGRLQLTSR